MLIYILGYQPDDVAQKFTKIVESKDALSNNIDGITDQVSKLNRVRKKTT